MRKNIVEIITHNDLDGIMSGVVNAIALEHIIRMVPEYRDVKPVVRFFSHFETAVQAVNDLNELGIQMVVTDLSPDKKENFFKLASVEPVIPELPVLVDHHRDSEAFEHHRRTMVSMKNCGAMNSMKYYQHLEGDLKVEFPEWLMYLVELTDDYDMWKHENPESRKLNILCSVLGADGLFQRIMSERENFTIDNEVIPRWVARQNRRLDKAETTGHVASIDNCDLRCIVVPPQDPFTGNDSNELAERFAAKGYECFAYIYAPYQNDSGVRISLRGKNGAPRKVLETLKTFGIKGGGHDNACGGRFKPGVSCEAAAEVILNAFHLFLGEKAAEKENSAVKTSGIPMEL